MYKPYRTPDLVLEEALRTYLLAHATPKPGEPWLYTVHTPLHVFKKACTSQGWEEVLINMIIPADEFLFASEKAWISDSWTINYRKMRASKAKVHSIVQILTHEQLSSARSNYDSYFKYRVGKSVLPARFTSRDVSCDPGIHFFLNVGDALNYSF